MKKLILPLFVAVVVLTSCSQSLYRNNYDWIKVEHVKTHLVQDTVHNNSSVAVAVDLKEKAPASNEQQTETKPEIAEKQNMDAIVIPAQVVQPPSKDSSRESKSDKKEQKQKKSGMNQQLTIGGGNHDIGHNFRKLFFDPSREHNMSTEEKGYVAGAIGLVVLAIVIAAAGLDIMIPILLTIAYIFTIIIGIVTIALMIYGIC